MYTLDSDFIFLLQIQKLSHSFTVPYDLDTLLSTVTITGSYIFAIFSILAAIVTITEVSSMIVFVQSALLLIQITLQGKFDCSEPAPPHPDHAAS